MPKYFVENFLFHQFNAAILASVVSLFVLWRYRVTVLDGMRRGEGEALPPPEVSPREDNAGAGTGTAAMLLWEKRRQRNIALAYLLTTLTCALPLAFTEPYLLDAPMFPWQMLLTAWVYAFACAPMIAASLALTPLRALAGLALLTILLTALDQAIYLVQYAFVRAPSGWSPTDFLDLVASTMWIPALFWLPTWPRKVRGVAPITFAALSLFALGVFISSEFEALGSKTAGPSWGLNGAFVLMALPAGWIAWMRLHQVARGYESKRFSDAQLLSRTWWLMLVLSIGFGLMPAGESRVPWLAMAVSTISLFSFAPVNNLLLAKIGPAAGQPPARNLLLLRVFGYTARTERLFDRIGARWRLFGPVTVIAAPDVSARTIGPGDYLRWLTGRADELFVTSRADLDARLAALDMRPDPDGRYRVNAFCCRDNTWQATVVELMRRADAVVMDVRGLKRGRHGCEFELEQLASMMPPRRVVLAADVTTELALLEEAFGRQLASARVVQVRGSRGAQFVFEALLEAAV